MSDGNAPGVTWTRARLHLPWVVIGIVGAGAFFEALVALGVLSLGPHPGEAPRGSGLIVVAAVLALIAAGVVALAISLTSRTAGLVPSSLVALLNLVAAAFVIARYLSYDPYYAPQLQRFSEGVVPVGWVVLVALLAGVAAWSIRRSLRAGLAVTGPVLWLSAGTAVFMGAGH